MELRTDIAVIDSAGEPTVLVEVKARRDMPSSWAAQLRRNLLAHGSLGRSKFFVLVTPDWIHVWRNQGAIEDLSRLPDFDVAAGPVFGPYVDAAELKPESLQGAAFELLVAEWLGDLARGATKRPEPTWMIESGLGEAVAGGTVRLQIAA
jgi:hypothetical protein